MTLPPDKIGDRGQRYEIRFRLLDPLGRPEPEERVFGWSDSLSGACIMRRAIRLHPSMTRPRIVDRRPHEPPAPRGGQSGRRNRHIRTRTRAAQA